MCVPTHLCSTWKWPPCMEEHTSTEASRLPGCCGGCMPGLPITVQWVGDMISHWLGRFVLRDGDTAEVITDAEANANTNTALTVKATCTGPQRSNRLQFTYRLQHLSQRNFKFFFSFFFGSWAHVADITADRWNSITATPMDRETWHYSSPHIMATTWICLNNAMQDNKGCISSKP